MLKKIPLPLVATALAIATIGNFFFDNLPVYIACFALAFSLFILVTIRILVTFNSLKEELNNIVLLSVMSTYPMTLSLLSSYLKRLFGFGELLWWIALILHVVVIIGVITLLLKNLNLNNIYASYFVLFIGILTASVTSPIFNNIALGKFLVFVNIAIFIVLFIIVSFRYIKVPVKSKMLKPLLCIYCAPLSLIIVALIKVGLINKQWLTIAFVFSQIIYLVIFSQLPKLMDIKNDEFFPTYSSFTFPTAITALSCKSIAVVLESSKLLYLSYFELVIALILLAYVWYGYYKTITNKKVFN